MEKIKKFKIGIFFGSVLAGSGDDFIGH